MGTTLNQFDGTDGEPFVYGSGTTLEDFDANHIRAALQAMPNFIIPSVNVTDSYPLGTAVTGVDDIRYNNRWFFDVTFTHPANLGEQKLMTCTIASTATDNAAVAPRMSAPTIWEHTGSLEDFLLARRLTRLTCCRIRKRVIPPRRTKPATG